MTRTNRPWNRWLAALLLMTLSASAEPALGPESQRRDGVPRGVVTQFEWNDSKIFPGTHRRVWVYAPTQLEPSAPAPVMVFQDGGGFVKEDGPYRATVVLDNLIAAKQIPPMVGVFIDPGVIPATSDAALPRNNRSFEYDTPSDQYARFLLEEILPEVGKTHRLTNDAAGRGLCGASSGGICAFAAAWERPDAFSRVISFVGSFTNIRGGDRYPGLVRRTEPRALRVFLQDGSNDLNIYAGDWWLANQSLTSALKYAGYEHQVVWGEGGHNGKHGGSVLPEALRYVWKDYPQPPPKATFAPINGDGRPTVMDLVSPDEPWRLVAEGFKFTEGPTPSADGEIFFTDIPNNRIHKIDASGNVSVFAENTGGANGLKFGPDGRLYACQGKAKQVVAYDADGTQHVVADGIECNDLAITHKGLLYVTEPNAKRVWRVRTDGNKRVVEGQKRSEAIERPNGVALTPDQSQLIVADTAGPAMYLFQIQPDGTLGLKAPYFTAQLPATKSGSGADGVTVDAEGRVYVTSHLGLQIFGREGVLLAILDKPQNAWLSNVCFGGKDLDTLYVTCGDKVFKRKVKAHGLLPWKGPAKPATAKK